MVKKPSSVTFTRKEMMRLESRLIDCHHGKPDGILRRVLIKLFARQAFPFDSSNISIDSEVSIL